jgi:uncharacterized protein YacL
MALIILRAVFVVVSAGLAVQLIYSGVLPQDREWNPMLVLGVVMLLAVCVILADILLPRKRLDVISAVYFGLVIGLFLTYVLRMALVPILPGQEFATNPWAQVVGLGAQLVLATSLCYICISLLLQTKDDFRFISPYVEFSRQIKGPKPYILDTSVVIDGRIADVVETQIIDNQFVMPRFVIGELQGIADSTDKMRRTRGRRGLDILNRLRSEGKVELTIFDRDLPEFAGQPVDLKLVLLARHLGGKVVTNDYNLNKVAKLHGVEVINLNDLANALKPVFLPGESFDVRIVKYGEEPGQGIGYLDDGTMVVVEGGRQHLNETVKITVTSVLQTSAGRMVFGRFEESVAV